MSQLKGTLNLTFRNMKVTRNVDDGSYQDPFYKIHYFQLNEKDYQKVDNKFDHDGKSKPIKTGKSKTHKNAGKEVDFNEKFAIPFSFTLQQHEDRMEPVPNDVCFIILHINDYDTFSNDNIGKCIFDLSKFFTDDNGLLVHTKQTKWWPIVFDKKQIGQFEVESTLDLSKGKDITSKVSLNHGNQSCMKKFGPQDFIQFEYINPKCKYGDKYDVEFPQVIDYIDGKPPPKPEVPEKVEKKEKSGFFHIPKVDIPIPGLSSVTKHMPHVGHTDSETAEEHQKKEEEARIAREKAARIQKLVWEFNNAFKDKYEKEIHERILAIKKINFDRAANDDLLGDYLKIDSYDQRQDYLILFSKLYFATAQQIQELNEEQPAYQGILFFILNVQVEESDKYAKAYKGTKDHQSLGRIVSYLGIYIKKLLTPKSSVKDQIDLCINFESLLTLMWADLAQQINALKNAHSNGLCKPNVESEKLNKDYTFLLQTYLDICIKQLTIYIEKKDNKELLIENTQDIMQQINKNFFMTEALVDDLSDLAKKNAQRAVNCSNLQSHMQPTEVARIKDTLSKLVAQLLVPAKGEIKEFFRDEEIKINASLNIYLSAKLKMRIISSGPAQPLIRKGSFQEEEKSNALDFENSQVLATEPANGNDDDFAAHLQTDVMMTESDLGNSEVLVTEGTRTESSGKSKSNPKSFAGKSPAGAGSKGKKKQMQEMEQGGCAQCQIF